MSYSPMTPPILDKQVYFLAPVGGGPVKIGCSYHPRNRLVIFSKWSPVPLEILTHAPGEPCVERAIHGRFAEHRLHSEWFSPAPELMAFIARIAATGKIPLNELDGRSLGDWGAKALRRLQAGNV